ncbi:MAG: SDR family oxidoreductase [Sedimentitalea sp.]
MAIITGASRGIGFRFAAAMLEAGFNVVLTGARSRENLMLATENLANLYNPDRVMYSLSDAGLAEDANRTVAETLDRFGRVDVLVNNAGRGPREISESFHTEPVKFWQTEPDDWSEIVRSNITGPFLMARAVAPSMIAQGWGRIIGISTSRVTMVRRGYAPYGPSKAALDAMTRVFAQDLEGTGVTCNILLPGGPTDTDFIPGARVGTYANLLGADVMNDALCWIASEASDGITAARFVGKFWDASDPAACREDTGAPPLIL